MTDNRILIYADRNGAEAFRREVSETAAACNSLINIFQAFQDWERITTIEMFAALVTDPGRHFDNVLLRNVRLDTGGRKPDPDVLAQLVGLHRGEYLNAVGGLPLTSSDCEPCRRAKVIPGRRAVSVRTYEAYSQYLTFSAGSFSVNIEAVEAATERYNYFATSPQEIERYRMFTSLVQTLNQWDAVFPFSGADKLTIKKIFNLHLTKADTGEFMLNTEDVKNKLMRL